MIDTNGLLTKKMYLDKPIKLCDGEETVGETDRTIQHSECRTLCA